MGVTFCGNFAPRTLLVPFHWRGMCDAHHAVDMPDRGSYWGQGLNNPFCSTWPALRASVRQMESTSHDPFATLAAFGCGRAGSTRHKLAGNALHSRAGAIARWFLSDLTFGQLSRRSARG